MGAAKLFYKKKALFISFIEFKYVFSSNVFFNISLNKILIYDCSVYDYDILFKFLWSISRNSISIKFIVNKIWKAYFNEFNKCY